MSNGRYAHFLYVEFERLNVKEKRLEALLAPTIQDMGFELWGIEYLSQGKRSLLRLFIEADNGVEIDHCAEVSRQVGDLLDVSEEITQGYTLEVSSPGLDRTLFKATQFTAYVGSEVDVRLNFPFEGKKRIRGRLAGFEDGEVIVAVKSDGDEDEEYVLPFENVRKVRLVPQFGTAKAEQ